MESDKRLDDRRWSSDVRCPATSGARKTRVPAPLLWLVRGGRRGAATSSIYGVTHYRSAIELGLVQGRCIGAAAAGLPLRIDRGDRGPTGVAWLSWRLQGAIGIIPARPRRPVRRFMPHSSRGLGHRPLKAEITGSNPVCGTKSVNLGPIHARIGLLRVRRGPQSIFVLGVESDHVLRCQPPDRDSAGGSYDSDADCRLTVLPKAQGSN